MPLTCQSIYQDEKLLEEAKTDLAPLGKNTMPLIENVDRSIAITHYGK
jgi:hypothetical protein